MKVVIFTDLDGTLLDHKTYSYDPARPALALLKRLDIPLVICTSKTSGEIEYLRQEIDNHDPFVSENGGGVFIPHGYFPFTAGHGGLAGLPADSIEVDEGGKYDVIRLGAKYQDLRRAVGTLRERGYPIRGFGDMTVEEVSETTGLSRELSALAKNRDFDEPFVVEESVPVSTRDLTGAIEALGFRYTIGRLGHLMGSSDKGKAVTLLTELYTLNFMERVFTIAVGDAPNDIPMLRAVDHPVIVQRPDGSYNPDIAMEGLIRAEGVGPRGWDLAVGEVVDRIYGNARLSSL